MWSSAARGLAPSPRCDDRGLHASSAIIAPYPRTATHVPATTSPALTVLAANSFFLGLPPGGLAPLGAGFFGAGFLGAGFLGAGFLGAGCLASGFFGAAFLPSGFFGAAFFALGGAGAALGAAGGAAACGAAAPDSTAPIRRSSEPILRFMRASFVFSASAATFVLISSGVAWLSPASSRATLSSRRLTREGREFFGLFSSVAASSTVWGWIGLPMNAAHCARPRARSPNDARIVAQLDARRLRGVAGAKSARDASKCSAARSSALEDSGHIVELTRGCHRGRAAARVGRAAGAPSSSSSSSRPRFTGAPR